MQINLLKTLRNKLRATKPTTPPTSPKEKEPIIPPDLVQIKTNTEGNFSVFEISKTTTFLDFYTACKQTQTNNLEDYISNAILFDGSFITGKKIYIFSQENKLYNIVSNDNTIHINERITYDTTDEHNKTFIDERIIKIDKTTNSFIVTRMKHDKNLSTFYVKYFASDEKDETLFHLDENTAIEISHEMLSNLSSIENIDKILDLSEVSKYLSFQDSTPPIQYVKKDSNKTSQ